MKSVAINPCRHAALLLGLGLLAASAHGAAQALPPSSLALLSRDGDLATEFACEVDMRLEVPQGEQSEYAQHLQAALVGAGLKDLAPQHVLVVDRSPKVQAGLLYRLTPDGNWRFTGATPVSTGLPGRFEHFATPLGVFAHSLDNLDYRAEGTRNEKAIRGYGRKGMRVFDFGWIAAAKSWGDGGMSVMRLQMHATDPDALERHLGRVRSKGCIRIPATLNDFLDRRGVLDAEYEAAVANGRGFWVLRHDREATRWAGRYLVVIDTERVQRPAWSPEPSARAPRPPGPDACGGQAVALAVEAAR